MTMDFLAILRIVRVVAEAIARVVGDSEHAEKDRRETPKGPRP